jgi:hypothetical protein
VKIEYYRLLIFNLKMKVYSGKYGVAVKYDSDRFELYHPGQDDPIVYTDHELLFIV